MTKNGRKQANKRKQSNNAGKGGAGAGKPRRSRGVSASVLDTPAQEYARLLMDPCGARVVQPIYPGGDAGYLFRAESFLTVGVGAGDTAGVIHWAPGYINSSNSDFIGFSAVASTTASTMIGVVNSPGKAFLQANARGFRCVAACMKVTYPGAESSRAGRIHYGLTTAGFLDLTETSITVDGVAQALQHYSRTPPDTVEIIWRPQLADTEMADPSSTQNAQIRDRKAAITLAYAGLPAAVGLTMHLTAVYEWTPAQNMGVGFNALGKAVSRNSLDDVLDYIKNMGFSYVRQAAQSAGTGITAGTLAAVYGLMGARPTARTLAFR